MPGSRDAERTLGAMHILNRGYVLSKHKPLGRRIVSAAYLFCFYKILSYGMGLRSRFGRDRLRSAFAAYRRAPRALRRLARTARSTVYRRLRARCLDA